MTNQSDRQADARSSTGTALTYEGDSLAYFDSQGVAAGEYNGRLLAWINQALGTSYTEINGAKAALANNISIPTWDGLNLLGKAGVSAPVAPNAPVLSLNSESGGLVSVLWDFDNTVAAGDTLTRQVQVSGGNWSSLIDNTAHIITSGEDTANLITASLTLPNGTYDIRGYVTSAATSLTSVASNILTLTISDAANYRIASTGNRRISSAGNLRKAS